MKRTITASSQSVTLRLVTGGEAVNPNASSPFGPLKVGLIPTPDQETVRVNQEAQLTALLRSLEKAAATLLFKSYAVLDTSLSATTHLAEPCTSTSDTTGTKICNECGDDLAAEGESKCLECLEKYDTLTQ